MCFILNYFIKQQSSKNVANGTFSQSNNNNANVLNVNIIFTHFVNNITIHKENQRAFENLP